MLHDITDQSGKRARRWKPHEAVSERTGCGSEGWGGKLKASCGLESEFFLVAALFSGDGGVSFFA